MPIRSDLKHPKALRCISNFPTGSQNDSPKLSDTSTLHQRKGHATPSGVKPSTPLGGGGIPQDKDERVHGPDFASVAHHSLNVFHESAKGQVSRIKIHVFQK